jgi:hypothetical protein
VEEVAHGGVQLTVTQAVLVVEVLMLVTAAQELLGKEMLVAVAQIGRVVVEVVLVELADQLLTAVLVALVALVCQIAILVLLLHTLVVGAELLSMAQLVLEVLAGAVQAGFMVAQTQLLELQTQVVVEVVVGILQVLTEAQVS